MLPIRSPSAGGAARPAATSSPIATTPVAASTPPATIGPVGSLDDAVELPPTAAIDHGSLVPRGLQTRVTATVWHNSAPPPLGSPTGAMGCQFDAP